MKRGRNVNTMVAKRVRRIAFGILLVVLTVFLCITVWRVSHKYFLKKFHREERVSKLYDEWNAHNYEEVYRISEAILEKNFLQNAARTFHGYSSFLLAVSENDNAEYQNLLDEAIINLRIALQYAKDDVKPQIEYMLGRTYFYKDVVPVHSDFYKDKESESQHYYSDLAIKYLLASQEDGFEAKDTSEYLGLSYAALGETQKSIEAFAQALKYRESDTLLLSIAEQYCNASQGKTAKQYLKRADNLTKDEDIKLRCKFLLAQICMEEESFEEAEQVFLEIAENQELPGSARADAHYGLGVIYEKQKDLVKARYEWRYALNLNSNHKGSRLKMAEHN
ncbi:MAG: tetratricopeptide repeat protein [Treponema sp.]|nr:tetratricopeptide repeat protein [Treponema sp.]